MLIGTCETPFIWDLGPDRGLPVPNRRDVRRGAVRVPDDAAAVRAGVAVEAGTYSSQVYTTQDSRVTILTASGADGGCVLLHWSSLEDLPELPGSTQEEVQMTMELESALGPLQQQEPDGPERPGRGEGEDGGHP